MARHPSGLRHLLGAGLSAGGDRRSRLRLSARSAEPAHDQSRSGSAISAAAEVSDRWLPGTVFRDAMGLRWSESRQRLFEFLFLLVAFVNRFLPVFIRQGGSHVLLADVRRRARAHRALV